MKPTRQDKESVGLGASVSLAVAGVIVAGLGLVTMRSAFPPLPKAETPVVLVHAEHPPLSAPDHAAAAASTTIVRSEAVAVHAADARRSPRKVVRTVRVVRREHAAARLEIRSDAAQAEIRPAAPPAAAPEKVAAQTGPDDGKLCKAPMPNEVAAKVMKPGLILRYDTQYKITPIDIPPPKPPPEEVRRLKLSALLKDMLDN